MTRPRLLVVHHTPSPNVRELLEAIVSGASLPEFAALEVAVEPALSATASDVLGTDAIVLLTPTNIGYMSGALKHFFDTIYYPCLDATRGLAWGLAVHGNNDTGGGIRSVEVVTGALGWRRAAPTLSVIGHPDAHALSQARDLGATLAAIAHEHGEAP